MISITNRQTETGFVLDAEVIGEPDVTMCELIVGVHAALQNIADTAKKTKREIEAQFVEEFIDSTRE